MARAVGADSHARRGLHPFDVLLVLVIAIGILPLGALWARIVWVLVLFGGTFVVRHHARSRARALTQAATVPPR